jgi:hypothetical protein
MSGKPAPDTSTAAWTSRGVLACAGVVIVSPLVAALVAWWKGWMPFGDEATAVAQAWGTLSTHPPSLGLYSTVSGAADASQTLYHPGPMQLWLIAGPLRLFAPSNGGALVGSALIVALALAVWSASAWRRGRLRFLVPSIVMVAWFIAVVGAQFLRAPYLDAASMFTMLGLIGAGWAVMNRDDWFWPAAVGCASVAAQSQVAFSVPVAAIAVAVAAVRTTTWIRDRRGRGARTVRRRSVTIAVVSVVVGLGCWSGPLYDQFFGSGNLWALLSAGAGSDAVGPSWAVDRLVDALAFPPSWTVHGLRVDGRVLPNGQMVWHTPTVHVIGAAVFTAVSVGLFVWSVRRRNRELVTLGVVAAAALAGSFVASSVMPNDPISLIGHNRAWLVAGFAAWTFTVLATVQWSLGMLRERTPTSTVWAAAGSGLAGVATLALVGSMLVASSPANDVSSSGYGAVARFAEVGHDYCNRSPGAVIVSRQGYGNTLTTVGLIAQLQIEGCEVHVDRDLSSTLPGAWFTATGNERYTLLVSQSPDGPKGFDRVSTYDPTRPPARYRGFDEVYSAMQRLAPLYLYVRER